MYEQQILRILLDVGARGISVKKLAKHVYNHYCTLFSQPDFADVHRRVYSYIISRSQRKHPLVESTGKWGHYRIPQRAIPTARQRLAAISPLADDDNTPADTTKQELAASQPDMSLSLFD